jgi:hypothetical protein
MRRKGLLILPLVALSSLCVFAQESPAAFSSVIERIGAREKANMLSLRQHSPVTETYIQRLKADADLGAVPTSDDYFLGRLDFSDGSPSGPSYMPQPSAGKKLLRKLTGIYKLNFLPLGFMQMMIVDSEGLDQSHYDFKFVRREFLGDVRCLVVDVAPKAKSGNGRFIGRIWVEDQDYNIIRFNGSYAPAPRGKVYLHFDSWRLNLQPGVWLPAYVYSEETDLGYATVRHARFKSQTRLWGYQLKSAGRREEFSSITVDSDETVRDQSEAARDLTPVESQRAWEHLAEDNVIDRLEKAGILAPEGEVDKVLQTVISNLEITNKLDLNPEVRARVMLTAPLESFTVGRTIVLSRGMLDVLPDEASLAAVLAHELAHVILGHPLDTKYAFSDRMIFPDEDSFMNLGFGHNAREENEADTKALELLKASPYGTPEKLKQVGLFLKAVDDRRQALPKLLHAHLGNSFMEKDGMRLRELMPEGPELQPRSVDQISALPVGARIKLDPWSDKVELVKKPIVPLVSPKEKMPFEVTPLYPHIARFTTGNVDVQAPATAAVKPQ